MAGFDCFVQPTERTVRIAINQRVRPRRAVRQAKGSQFAIVGLPQIIRQRVA